MATIDDFHNIEMKIGTILKAEYIEGADKLLRLEVDFGPLVALVTEATGERETIADVSGNNEAGVPTRDVRQILSGIREWYKPEELIGKQCPFVTNLPARTMRGLESHGMILAVKTPEGGAVILHPDRDVPDGCHLS